MRTGFYIKRYIKPFILSFRCSENYSWKCSKWERFSIWEWPIVQVWIEDIFVEGKQYWFLLLPMKRKLMPHIVTRQLIVLLNYGDSCATGYTAIL